MDENLPSTKALLRRGAEAGTAKMTRIADVVLLINLLFYG